MSALTLYGDFHNPYITYLNSELDRIYEYTDEYLTRTCMLRVICTGTLLLDMMPSPTDKVAIVINLIHLLSEYEKSYGLITTIRDREVSLFMAPAARMSHQQQNQTSHASMFSVDIKRQFISTTREFIVKTTEFTNSAHVPTPAGITSITVQEDTLEANKRRWEPGMSITFPANSITIINWDDLTKDPAHTIAEIFAWRTFALEAEEYDNEP
jgi:hypothetical protein